MKTTLKLFPVITSGKGGGRDGGEKGLGCLILKYGSLKHECICVSLN